MSEDKLLRDKAITKQIVDVTYRLLDEDDCTLGGTAVALKIGGRHFLATAAHILSNKHRLSVHLKTEDLRFSGFSGREYCPDDDPDVGFLEIPQEDIRRLPWAFLDGKHVVTSFDRNSALLVRVVGFPGEYMRVIKREQIGSNDLRETRAIRGFHYLTHLLPRAKCPESTDGDESVLYLDFNPDLPVLSDPSNMIDVVPKETGEMAPPLYGISGGGIWLEQEATEKGIWRADTKLLALQSSYHKGDGWIKGTSMVKWLDLVEGCYPDLKQAIANIRSGGITAN